MEGTIGEIRWFAGNFAPKDWAFCQGQLVPITQNTALFSIVGTYYGGDGKTTFALPDFRDRAAVGVGQGPGLSLYQIGEAVGASTVALISTELPLHNHGVNVTPGTSSVTATLNGVTGSAATSNPTGALLLGDANMNTFAAGNSPTTPMAAAGATLSNVTGPTTLPTVTISPTGGSQPHNNLQPYLGMNFIICMYGTFPSRN